MAEADLSPPAEERASILVWDLPVRLFHVAFAASLLGAFTIGQLADDDSAVFPVHMLLGGTLVGMVLLRILWGVVGSRYARFRSFVFGPGEVLAYLRGALTGEGKRYVGHNPGASLAIFALLALTLGLGVTGALMAQGGELMEELHELLAYSAVAVVGIHVAGVAWHSLRFRENLPLSMLHGRKLGAPEQGLQSAHPVAAVLFVVLTAAWAGALARGYDASTSQVTLPGVGLTLQLGEGEHEHPRSPYHDDDDD